MNLVVACKRKHLLRNNPLKASQDHKGNNHDRQADRDAGHGNAVNGSGEAARPFKADSFGNEIGKIQ